MRLNLALLFKRVKCHLHAQKIQGSLLRGLLYGLLLFSMHAQIHAQVLDDLFEDMALEFLAMKSQLNAVSLAKLKRMISKYARVDSILVVIGEDGSYLELLCEDRARYVKAVLISLGAQPSQVTTRCPAPRGFNQGGQDSGPSSLSIQGALIDVQSRLESGQRHQNRYPSKPLMKDLAKEVPKEVPKEAPKEVLKQPVKEMPTVPMKPSTESARSGPIKPSNFQVQVEPSIKEFSAQNDSKQMPALRDEGVLNVGPSVEKSLQQEGEKVSNPNALLSKPPTLTKIPKGGLVHVFLRDLAQSEGWTFIWYPSVSWKAIADIDLTAYLNAERAVVELVSLLRLEGKPIQLRLSAGNKVMEVLSTEVVND